MRHFMFLAVVLFVFGLPFKGFAEELPSIGGIGYHEGKAYFGDNHFTTKEELDKARTRYTSDPNHPGWFDAVVIGTHKETGEKKKFKAHTRVKWKNIETQCTPCKQTVKTYNEVVSKLLSTRSDVAYYQNLDVKKELQRIKDSKGVYGGRGKPDLKAGEYDYNFLFTEGMAIASALDLKENIDKIKAMETKRLKILEDVEKDLRKQIDICEKQCKGEEGEIIIGDPAILQLSYPWKGPYTTECWKCQKLVDHLNKLPGMTYPLLAEQKLLESQILHWEAYRIDGIRMFDAGIGEENDAIGWAESHLSDLRPKLAEVNRKLGLIQTNFNQTIALYNDCEKSCKPVEEISCEFDASNEMAITVGPNNEVGSSAEFKNKLQNQAKGAAMGALGSMLGGGAVSVGGGGKGQKGPKTDKDPTTGKTVNISAGNTDLEVRAAFTDDGLVISTNIDDSPGDGTFQVMWIEDTEGRIHLPTRYWIFSLWRGWKLTVWWTYDRWVNGEHVEHREGRESSFGWEHLGNFLVSMSESEGFKNSIWYTLGFETAKKGVRKLGTGFQLPASVLASPCPVRVVTHITLPKEDPVVTQPIAYTLGGKDADVTVEGWGPDGEAAQRPVTPPELEELEAVSEDTAGAVAEEPAEKPKKKKKERSGKRKVGNFN